MPFSAPGDGDRLNVLCADDMREIGRSYGALRGVDLSKPPSTEQLRGTVTKPLDVRNAPRGRSDNPTTRSPGYAERWPGLRRVHM